MQFGRRFEDPVVRGYILDVGPRFFILALVNDRLWFDGYECFRIGDVRGLRSDLYAPFAEAALRARGERLRRQPGVSVAGVRALLATANRAFPLITIHREVVDPTVCWIGRVVDVERGRVSLLQIRPDATWEETPTVYRLSEITRVSFGGDYEGALHLVGGRPPKPTPPRHGGRTRS